MMKKFLGFLLLGLLATSSRAAIVYNNGAPDGVSGNDATAWIQAENFSISDGATITGAEVFLGGSGGISAWDGTLTYYFFTDANNLPGSLIVSGSATGLSATPTSTDFFLSGKTYSVLFSLESSFTAAPGTNYWFGIHAASDFNRDFIYWVTTAPTTGNGYENFEGTSDWLANEQEHAFNLRSADTTPVPLPAAAWLLLSGLAGLGLFGRRRAAR